MELSLHEQVNALAGADPEFARRAGTQHDLVEGLGRCQFAQQGIAAGAGNHLCARNEMHRVKEKVGHGIQGAGQRQVEADPR
ncbi:hypothetical protein D3C80_1611400 [compost metagenome]